MSSINNDLDFIDKCSCGLYPVANSHNDLSINFECKPCRIESPRIGAFKDAAYLWNRSKYKTNYLFQYFLKFKVYLN